MASRAAEIPGPGMYDVTGLNALSRPKTVAALRQQMEVVRQRVQAFHVTSSVTAQPLDRTPLKSSARRQRLRPHTAAPASIGTAHTKCTDGTEMHSRARAHSVDSHELTTLASCNQTASEEDCNDSRSNGNEEGTDGSAELSPRTSMQNFMEVQSMSNESVSSP